MKFGTDIFAESYNMDLILVPIDPNNILYKTQIIRHWFYLIAIQLIVKIVRVMKH